MIQPKNVFFRDMSRCREFFCKYKRKLKVIDRLCTTHECPLITDKQTIPMDWYGHSQLPLAELGKPSPNIDLLRTTGSNGRA